MANVFGQMKDLYRMQREAKKMQAKMREVKVTGRSKDERVKMYFNGAQELEDIKIDETLLVTDEKEKLEEGIKEAYKDFQSRLQKELAKDMDMDQLRGMLGG